MASVSTWADEVRTRTDAAWHYVNLEPNSGCRYVPSRDCPGGNCVVAAIEQQLAILRSSSADEARLRALKYVIHLVADVHQPLHAGHASDRGGNSFQLQAFGRGTNLHAAWDTDLVVNWPGGLSGLRLALGAKTAVPDGARSAAQWAEESCQIVEASWFYPQTRRLDDAYQDKASPIVRDRIAIAASRLSSLLITALAR